MTEFERGRAAGLAEAVKVVQGYGDMVKDHGHMPVDPYKAVCEAVSEIAAAIQALAAPPTNYVFDPTRCKICDWPLAKSAAEGCVENNCSYRPPEGSEEYRRIEQRRAMIAQGEK